MRSVLLSKCLNTRRVATPRPQAAASDITGPGILTSLEKLRSTMAAKK